MTKLENLFYGQQEGERVLYEVRPHETAILFKNLKVLLAAMVVLGGTLAISSQVPAVAGMVFFWGLMLVLIILGVGLWSVKIMQQKSVAFITDRRVIRFSPASPFEIRTRSLNWEDATKVKTYPPNFLWRLLKIGSVVIHSHTSVIDVPQAAISSAIISEDDVELADVYYFTDLGNYIDKVLYLYRKKPEELDAIRRFVPKPRGKRY
jgi:hypothetical protein